MYSAIIQPGTILGFSIVLYYLPSFLTPPCLFFYSTLKHRTDNLKQCTVVPDVIAEQGTESSMHIVTA